MKLVALSIALICSTTTISKADEASRVRCLDNKLGQRCWALKKTEPISIPKQVAGYNFEEVTVTEIGINTDATILVTVVWKGTAGVMKFNGPHGTTFATGTIETDADGKRHIYFNLYEDSSISEPFDRALVFNESDPDRLHVLTKDWFNLVIAPYLEKHVFSETLSLP